MIVIVLIVTSVFAHLADDWTIPLQNDTTMAQVNGDGVDLAVMKSSNSFLNTVRISIWPLAIVICLLVAGSEILRINKELDKKDDSEEKNS